MYGLKNMGADTAETREMLSAITEKISVYKITLTSQSIGNCLYGMKRMSSDYPEVRAMLAALLPLLQSCTQSMSAQELSNAIYGMQKMSVKCEEVCQVLTVITIKLEACSDDLNGQCLVSIMSGLQRMDFDHPAVSAVLLALGPKIDSSAEIFELDALCFAVYTLGSIKKNESAGSKAILSAIAKKLEHVDTWTSLKKLRMASIGLKQMDENSPEVIALQAALKRFVPQLPSANS
jgi:hypothetical protein